MEKYLLSIQLYLRDALATLPNHINYLHPNIEDMMILYFYHNLSYICYYLLHIDELHGIFAYQYIKSVNSSNFTSVFFKAGCHAYPGAEINFTGSK